ncbi:MAG: CHAP domain-containing protein [Candidatus Saccharimonadales bacterium]
MKKQKATPVRRFLTNTRNITGMLMIIAVLVIGMSIKPSVKADSVSDQINTLQQENARNNDVVANLQDQATSYQDAIGKLQAAIATLQSQIDANTAEQNRLQTEITNAENELVKQKEVLGTNIKQMYLEGQISTLEMLASSKDLSQFVDKQQYRNSVQQKIKTTLDKITALKHQLNSQKEQIEKLLADQKQKQSSQQASRAEQANLLSFNEGQQSVYNQKTKDNQSKIDALIASQRRANFNPDGGYYFLRFPGPVNGINPNAYPYANAGFGMSPGPGCVDNDGPDPWGYCTRQCVSYTAWAVQASGRSAPSFYGNARDWVGAAYARGIQVSRTPQPGDVAISTSGYWGHAMYVQGVSGGSFTTSEYNTYLTGQLSYQTRNY